MDPAEPSVSTQPEFPNPRRRWYLVVGILGLVIVVAVLGTWSLLSLRGEVDVSVPAAIDDKAGTLPEGDETIPEPAVPVTQDILPNRQPQEALALQLAYTQGESFQLEITDLAKTYATPTVEFLAPGEDQAFSFVELRDVSGRVLVAHQITVQTFGTFEDFATNQATVHAFPDATVDMIIPLPTTGVVREVRVTTPDGIVLSEQSFVLDQLPEVEGQPAAHVSDMWRQFASLFVPSFVRAATPQQIVVVRMENVSEVVHEQLYQRVRGDMQQVEPWSNFAGSLSVIKHPDAATEAATGCRAQTVPGVGIFPSCSNTGRLMSWVTQTYPNVHSVVVAVNVPCACGSAWLNSRATAVGTIDQPGLVAHELGHAVAGLADEYMGERGLRGAPGPNCFSTESQCRLSVARFTAPESQTDLLCEPGCNDLLTWRSSELLMYNNLVSERYGPIQQCLLYDALVRQLVGGGPPCPLLAVEPSPAVSVEPPLLAPAAESPTPVVSRQPVEEESSQLSPGATYYGVKKPRPQ